MKNGWHILTYHNISWEETPYFRSLGGTCPPDRFREHLECLKQLGKLVSIPEGLHLFQHQDISTPIFSIWFDDGLSGVSQYALPILQEHGISAAVSVCSRFVSREEFFWRCKLSYLASVDGLRFLRSRFKKFGYQRDDSLRAFTKTHFSHPLLHEIDALFQKMTSKAQREDAFRLFDTRAGLLKLQDADWLIANHTAAHYPIATNSFAEQFFPQFDECGMFLREAFSEDSRYWVLPFGYADSSINRVFEAFHQKYPEKYIVHVGNKINQRTHLANYELFRISAPLVKREQFITFLETL